MLEETLEEKGKNATMEQFDLPPASNFWPKFPKKMKNFKEKSAQIQKFFAIASSHPQKKIPKF
jgi:hypothetical protein